MMEQIRNNPAPQKIMDNRVTHYNGISYYYNELGNIVCREAQGIIQNLYYDLFDQLIRIETFTKFENNTWEKDVWAYEYDALRRRTKKAKILDDGTQTNITEFLWDGSRLFQEIYANGRYTYTYADQNSYEPLAQVHNWTNAEGETNETIFYFHCDQASSPREMTDKDGNLVWYGKYRAWGQLTFAESLVPNVHQPFRLQGQYYDPESGLHYNFHRYYDPNFGRFMTQDPIGLAGGSNAYFAFPNAQTWADPLGLIRILPGKKGTSVHANPGPNATPPGSRAEHDPPHVHLGSNDGPRMSTETFEPFTDADNRKMSKEQKDFCKGLRKEKDSQRRETIQKRQQQVFDTGTFDE
ncbi:Cell wall-associated polypeptide CWBP200 [Neisseria animaloris]|uniref:RHS repeat domain-containing protein n=1 Tax=Neisseria animaloris TaxID=326522 RepID=UPI000A196CD1|nr:RHS repeat-associated core domain-containing protein [Neisseria animaloris]OSI08858.1 hypothetical protein BWD08_01730 [Neisseria animaloris]VEH87171.1 Cell wall-associated polypeptide CWBP200 [Neisseria animaloris]